jgi:hypothetical protein
VVFLGFSRVGFYLFIFFPSLGVVLRVFGWVYWGFFYLGVPLAFLILK